MRNFWADSQVNPVASTLEHPESPQLTLHPLTIPHKTTLSWEGGGQTARAALNQAQRPSKRIQEAGE